MSAKFQLSLPQYRTLKAIAKKAKTRNQIKAAAFNGTSTNLAVVLNPMLKAKPALVKMTVLPVDGKDEEVFGATAAGVKLSQGSAPATRAAVGDHKSLPKVGGVIERTFKGT